MDPAGWAGHEHKQAQHQGIEDAIDVNPNSHSNGQHAPARLDGEGIVWGGGRGCGLIPCVHV